MNLAWQDIRFYWSRFSITALGVGILLTAALGIIGVYRGLIHDALLMIDEAGADLWVVQAKTHGPFAEGSRIAATLDRRVQGISGVKQARRYIHYNKQFYFGGRRQGLTITGLDYPYDNGSWIKLTAGRYLGSRNYEVIIDNSSGLMLGERVRLGRDDYTIVGLTSGQVDFSGDPLVYVSMADAQSIIDRDQTSETVLLSRVTQLQATSNPNGPAVAAIMVKLNDRSQTQRITRIITQWGDVRVFTQEEQRDLMVNGKLYKLRIQVLAYLAIMLSVTGAVVSLSVYTTVVEKRHAIALLKLMGAQERVIIGMIVQYALAIGFLALVLGQALSMMILPMFPRTVVVLPSDVVELALAVAAVCAASSWFGILNAKKVRAQEVLA